MKLWILFFIYIVSCSGFFVKFPFGKKFSIKDKEVKKEIEYKLPKEKQEIINKITGLYALIGPDIHIKNVSTLFDLFIGDGVIQSVFFDNGKITYVKHYVRTEKLLYEQSYGKLPRYVFLQLLFMLLHKMKMLPNTLGLANTSIMNIDRKFYALYERDTPYLLDIDFNKKEITTIKRIDIMGMKYFSAHSKYDKTVSSIEYNMMQNNINYHELSEDLTPIKHKAIQMKYLPLVHDFINTNNNIIITDSPIVIDLSCLFTKSLPILLDKEKPTIIKVLNKHTMKIEEYSIPTGFYIFHYADYKEDQYNIEIYAPLYEHLDFSELNISGKYRKIVIHKETKTVVIMKNPELETLDLEFPVKFGDKIVFRSIENKRINGFVICRDLEVIKKLNFGNKFISGEPAVTYIENIPYLITFGFNDNKSDDSYLIIVNMDTYEVIEIPIHETLNIGFHSIFIQKKID
jgi:carotenoid cleavage dioxygenase-like enzyme